MEPIRSTENEFADSIVELQPVPAVVARDAIAIARQDNSHAESNDGDANGAVRGQMPPPVIAVDTLERWNTPHKNCWGVLATFGSVFDKHFCDFQRIRF